MDNRNNIPPEGKDVLSSLSLSDSQNQQVSDILQRNGYENLEAFLQKNPKQRNVMQEEGDGAFYHPFKLAQKLTLFFAGKEETHKNPVLFKTPSFKRQR